jgi:hypothetical protein
MRSTRDRGRAGDKGIVLAVTMLLPEGREVVILRTALKILPEACEANALLVGEDEHLLTRVRHTQNTVALGRSMQILDEWVSV